MLKSCWDCLVGDGTRNEEPYSVQLNGNISRAPPWPIPQKDNEKMFLLPKQLEVDDSITVKCETSDQPETLKIGLVTGSHSPDYNNLACQLELNFSSQYDGEWAITLVKDGQYNQVDKGPAAIGNNFSVKFTMRDEVIYIFLRNNTDSYSELSSVQLMHGVESIRFITVNGDIKKVLGLEFQFGFQGEIY